jgi:surface antigen
MEIPVENTKSADLPMTRDGLTTSRPYFRHCNWCNKEKAPEGGVYMGANHWKCAFCWLKKARAQVKGVE